MAEGKGGNNWRVVFLVLLGVGVFMAATHSGKSGKQAAVSANSKWMPGSTEGGVHYKSGMGRGGGAPAASGGPTINGYQKPGVGF